MKSINVWAPVLVLNAVFQFSYPLTCPQDQKPNNQDGAAKSQPIPALGTAVTPRPAQPFVLVEDTPIKLKLTRTMSSHDAKVDEKVVFEVIDDVKVGDVVVIKRGASAIAIVTEAKPKGLTHSGKLNMNIAYVQLVSGDKAPLRATKVTKAENQSAVVKGAMLASTLLSFPTPMLFAKEITIQKGTEVTSYVAADIQLDPVKFGETRL